MKKKTAKTRKVSRFIYWTPRILSILFLLFLAVFSFDVFDSCAGFLDCAIGLFMHNIPVFVLAIVLWIAWKHELVGAITFCLAGLLYVYLTLFRAQIPWYTALSWSMIIAGPAFIIAILFYLNWKRK